MIEESVSATLDKLCCFITYYASASKNEIIEDLLGNRVIGLRMAFQSLPPINSGAQAVIALMKHIG